MNNENDILEMLDRIDEEGISMSDDSYIDSDYEASERSDGNSIITDSDVDHTTTPSNSSDNNVSFDQNINFRPVNEPVSDVSIQSFSSDDESDVSDWEENKLDEIEDFNFDNNSAGIKIEINDDSSPIDVFLKIWDDDIFDLILTCTNNYQKKINSLNRPHTKYGRLKNVSPVTREDLEKFFGLCLLRGQLKLPVLRNAFSSNPLYYHPIFNATMSGRKFEKILRSLNCSEGLNLNTRDRLYKVTVLMNKLIKKFQDSFSPEEALSLDESMLLWRGRLIFRQYIKNKKHKYGIKFYELCSPDGYVLNIEIYKGKNVEVTGNSKINDLVLRLVKPYLNKGHHLYMDNYYNSVNLSNILYKQRTHTTGTLRSNRKNNPTSIVKKTLKLKKGDHCFAKKGPVYVSRWKDKREVFSITTGHHPEMVITSNRFCQQQSTKPRHIVEYNKNMSGIDRSDQMVSYYSSPKKTIRWYKKVIFHLLDISMWNAYYLYKKKLNNINLRYIDFHSSVITKLLHLPENIVHGSQLVNKKNIRIRTSDKPRNTSVVLEHVQEKIPHPPGWKRKGYYLRCRQCTSQKQVKQTSWRCKNCPEKPPLCPGPCFLDYHSVA
ncbi:unnamed protein product [Macrosiphum euphorbiae]|uniref:PiggyBac transposable element-derived protein domain-containing protein n=1 Tax=Macrosiphum euphorbiae TaxID=13131 RepID=A0AAV0XZR8_9HEMI|nr:unnamed protein product [Macrosiphum euphorbiae]CAI6374055.1 unnamed protein product [Macrosiphum euphorbiae]